MAILVQRIESGETGRGIPDLYIRTQKREIWIELKNSYKQSIFDSKWKIGWRPGQQAWSLRYKKVCSLHTYTIVALRDGFLCIPMIKLYGDNIVGKGECVRFTKIADIRDILSKIIERKV
jgi:hypothetical protein